MKTNRSFVRRLLRWRMLFVVNGVVAIFLFFVLGREYIQTRQIRNEIQSLQEQADTLVEKNVSMKELQTAIRTQSHIEREARLKLGMKKPGEQVVIMVDDALVQEEDDRTATDGSNDPLGLVLDAETTFPEIANPTRWWYYFFDKSAFESLKNKPYAN